MYKILISYEGTLYSGWQVQPNGISIQQLLQEAASTILRHPVQITGSGRTDAGVHATGQIAHIQEKTLPEQFLLQMNGILPPDIRVKSMEKVDADFHARYSAVGKIYHYHVTLGPIDDPFRRRFALHWPYPFDLDAIRKTAHKLVGTHNFTSFANEGGSAKDKVRTLKRCDLIEEEHGVRFELEANGFLYKMVRNIVGTLLEQQGDISAILAAKDRKAAGKAAKPHGLFLVKVLY